jgi:hypothetical protein
LKFKFDLDSNKFSKRKMDLQLEKDFQTLKPSLGHFPFAWPFSTVTWTSMAQPTFLFSFRMQSSPRPNYPPQCQANLAASIGTLLGSLPKLRQSNPTRVSFPDVVLNSPLFDFLMEAAIWSLARDKMS